MLPEAVEFARPLVLATVRREGQDMRLEANAAECAALAARFGIPGIDSLVASLRLSLEPDGAIRAAGKLCAEVVQECVVTLEPVAQRVEEPVALRLLPPGQASADGPEDLDEIESGADGRVDLGEALAEQLSLALDPYPRAPGATLPPEVQESGHPGLAALRLRRDGSKG